MGNPFALYRSTIIGRKRGICINLSEIDFQIRDRFATILHTLRSSDARNELPIILRKFGAHFATNSCNPPRERPPFGISDFEGGGPKFLLKSIVSYVAIEEPLIKSDFRGFPQSEPKLLDLQESLRFGGQKNALSGSLFGSLSSHLGAKAESRFLVTFQSLYRRNRNVHKIWVANPTQQGGTCGDSLEKSSRPPLSPPFSGFGGF